MMQDKPNNSSNVIPLNGALRGLRGGHAPIAGDTLHVVSADGICVGGMVSITFDDHPMEPLVTLMIPQMGMGPSGEPVGAPAMCIGRVRHSDDHQPRTWHDPQKCKGEHSGKKRVIAPVQGMLH
jgi:hypothetical protein